MYLATEELKAFLTDQVRNFGLPAHAAVDVLAEHVNGPPLTWEDVADILDPYPTAAEAALLSA